MTRNRCRDPNPGGTHDRGFTLVEVMVSIMVSAMMVTAFFSIALTSRIQTVRADYKLAANQLAQGVLQSLKNYVADKDAYATGWLKLPNDGKLTDDASGLWALAAGPHDVTDIMKADPTFHDGTSWLVDTPSMIYCVADAGTYFACANFEATFCPLTTNPIKCVAIAVNWTAKGV